MYNSHSTHVQLTQHMTIRADNTCLTPTTFNPTPTTCIHETAHRSNSNQNTSTYHADVDLLRQPRPTIHTDNTPRLEARPFFLRNRSSPSRQETCTPELPHSSGNPKTESSRACICAVPLKAAQVAPRPHPRHWALFRAQRALGIYSQLHNPA